MNNQFANTPEEELIAILITLDGKGKEAKESALNELLERKFDSGYSCGSNSIGWLP